jgi:hypothetical protein
METAGETMRAVCSNKQCETQDLATKVHEDFEDLDFVLCWRCGEKVLNVMKINFPHWDLRTS